jgi:hypothetical protein
MYFGLASGQSPRKRAALRANHSDFFNISKYVGPVKVFGVINFMFRTHYSLSADALSPFDRVTSLSANSYPTKMLGLFSHHLVAEPTRHLFGYFRSG